MLKNYSKGALAIASSIQKAAVDLNLNAVPALIPTLKEYDAISLFDSLITDQNLRVTTRKLFIDGHYALAVEEGFKCVNNAVKSRSGLNADGAGLMRTVFSPNKPILKLNDLKTVSQRDQQQGYMDIFAGCMTGIRNPRAHEHRYWDEINVALELLALANHLLQMANKAKRSRKNRAL